MPSAAKSCEMILMLKLFVKDDFQWLPHELSLDIYKS